MVTRLNQLCLGVDRTADMGPFPHDESAKPIITANTDELMKIVDSSADSAARGEPRCHPS